MRSNIGRLLVAGAVVTALWSAVPVSPAFASPLQEVVLRPAAVSAGGRVLVELHGCPAANVSAFSDVFTAPVRLADTGKVDNIFGIPIRAGSATVSRTAKPGSATVTTNCPNPELARPAALTVLPRSTEPSAAQPGKSRPQVPRKPKGPAQTGGGGTAVS